MKTMLRALYLSALWLFAFPSMAQPTDQPWPMKYHDAQHTGRSPYPGPSTFSAKWQMKNLSPGGVIGSGGVLYVRGTEGEAQKMYALDVASGGMIASSDLPCAIMALGPDGIAYAICGGDVQSVRAFDGTSLQQLWEIPLSGELFGQIVVGPTGQVIVRAYQSDTEMNRVMSLNGQTGQLSWEYDFTDRRYYWDQAMAVSSDNRVIVPTFMVPGIVLDGSTGTKLYESYEVWGQVPVIGSDGVGYGFSGGALDNTGTLGAFDLDTGVMLWTRSVQGDTRFRTPPTYMASTVPTLDSLGRVYLPWGRYLYVFDSLTGDWLCQKELSPGVDCTSVALDRWHNAYVACGQKVFVIEPLAFQTVTEYSAPVSMGGMIIGPGKTLYANGVVLGEGPFVLPNLYLLPATAHTIGAAGTNWRTDLDIHNPSSHATAHVILAFMMTGQDNSGFESVEREIPPCSSMGIDDVVLSLFGHDGSGAILIQSDQPDLTITSRTYNDQPKGTYGQFVPAVPEARLGGSLLTQLTENDLYRTNVGLASLLELEQTAKLDLYDSDGTLLKHMEVVVPPLGHVQLNQIFQSAGAAPVKNGFIIVAGTRMAAYASVVDNRTGDAIYIPATVVGSN